MRLRPKRLTGFAVIGLVVISLTAGYLYFWQSRPVGHGPAGPRIPHQDFAGVWTDKSVVLVGLGDSVTAGFGARHGYSYFDRLVVNLKDEFKELQGVCLQSVLPSLRFTNLAVSGSISQEHAESQLPKLKIDSNSIAIVVITTGGNDIIHNYGRTPPREGAMYGASWGEAQPWIADFEARLETIINGVEACFPAGCHVFIANIFDPTDGRGDIERAGLPRWTEGLKVLEAYNDVIFRSTQKHRNVHLVDVHRTFLGHGIHCTQFWLPDYDSHDPHYWYYENLEDPNERGYDVIRRLFLTEIAKVANQLK